VTKRKLGDGNGKKAEKGAGLPEEGYDRKEGRQVLVFITRGKRLPLRICIRGNGDMPALSKVS